MEESMDMPGSEAKATAHHLRLPLVRHLSITSLETELYQTDNVLWHSVANNWLELMKI
jgi:hypothetical protein